jgi:hypothetical protein
MMERVMSTTSWIVTVAGIGAAMTATAAKVGVKRPPAIAVPAQVIVPAVPRANGDSLTTRIVSHDVFRSVRRPTAVPFEPVGVDVQPEDAPDKPRLRLLGVVVGDGQRALIEGIPGTTGARLLSLNDTAGGLRLTAITRRGARLTGMDTTWTLSIDRGP